MTGRQRSAWPPRYGRSGSSAATSARAAGGSPKRWTARAAAVAPPCGSTAWPARRGWRWTRRRTTRRRSAARRPCALARELGDPRTLAAALNTRGLLARAQDRYADSARDHQAALEQARAAADRAGEAVALLGLAYAAMFTGDAPRAGALAEESLAAARDSGDRHTLAQVLFLLGWGASNAGPGASERAEAFGTEALGLFRALGDTGGQADALFMLGTFGINSGDYQRAARFFAGSLALLRERGDEKTTARGLGGLGTALLNLGDRATAREYSRKAWSWPGSTATAGARPCR